MSEHFNGIFYQRFGNPAKPAVLFLHGFLGDNEDWHNVVEMVSKNFFCITIDLPGHGNSNTSELTKSVWDFHSFSLCLSELLTDLSIKKINLVGYSMGGRIAQHFALNYPVRLSKLVLESSSPGIKDKNERNIRLQNEQLLAKRLQSEPLSKFMDFWYDQPLFDGIKNHPQYNEMIKRRLTNNPQLIAKALVAFSVANQSYLSEELSTLNIPVLLLCGENDSKYIEIMKGLKMLNPEFKLYVIDKCGHNIHFERPNLFAEHLVEFLSL